MYCIVYYIIILYVYKHNNACIRVIIGRNINRLKGR